ncbi:hypothetical protein STEG23_006682, partial [Scotinomys teguina]
MWTFVVCAVSRNHVKVHVGIHAASGAQRLWYEFMKKLLACGLADPNLDPSYELPVVVEHTAMLLPGMKGSPLLVGEKLPGPSSYKEASAKGGKVNKTLEDEGRLHQQFESYKEQVRKIGEEARRYQGEHKDDAPTCGICHKTKFADGCGHLCSYCRTKFCARCGGRVSLRSNN